MESEAAANSGLEAPRVALCVHVKNRLWQVRHVLPINLCHLWRSRAWAKFVLVDFGSQDGLEDFVLRTCMAAMDVGLLRFFTAPPQAIFHTAVTKNVAHRAAIDTFVLGDHDILVNCDADNLLGPGFADHVRQMFMDQPKSLVHYFSGDWDAGTYGRIPLTLARAKTDRPNTPQG